MIIMYNNLHSITMLANLLPNVIFYYNYAYDLKLYDVLNKIYFNKVTRPFDINMVSNPNSKWVWFDEFEYFVKL